MLLNKELIPLIESNIDNMTNSEKEIAYYFLKQEFIEENSIDYFSNKLHVSKATLTRFAKKCGFSGFREFLYKYIDCLKDKESKTVYKSLTRKVLLDYQELLNKNYSIIDENQLERIKDMVEKASRIYLYGKGSSGFALQEMKLRFMRLGKAVDVITDEDMFLWNNLLLDTNCLVIGATISGKTKVILDSLRDAKSKGGKAILMTTRHYENDSIYCDELLLLPSNKFLSHGNKISPQIPILLMTDCLLSYYLDNPEIKEHYNKTIIYKDEEF